MTRTQNAPHYGKIIQRRRIERGDTQESLAEAIGLSQPFIGKLERGAADVTAMKLRNFAALLERLHWSASEFAQETGLDIAPLLQVEVPLRPLPSATTQSEPKILRAEVLSSASAGPPTTDTALERSGHTYLHGEDVVAGLALYVVDGHSMTTNDPNSIQDGDILHVDTHQHALQDGKVYLVQIIGNGLAVKRVRMLGGEAWLMSDNPEYPTFRPDQAEVVGRVTGWTRTLRP